MGKYGDMVEKKGDAQENEGCLGKMRGCCGKRGKVKRELRRCFAKIRDARVGKKRVIIGRGKV